MGKIFFLTSKSVDIICEGRNQTELQDFQPRVNGDTVQLKNPYMVEYNVIQKVQVLCGQFSFLLKDSP